MKTLLLAGWTAKSIKAMKEADKAYFVTIEKPGGTLENAQAMAAHESPRTTKLYAHGCFGSCASFWSP
jgi:hypothetical protein